MPPIQHLPISRPVTVLLTGVRLLHQGWFTLFVFIALIVALCTYFASLHSAREVRRVSTAPSTVRPISLSNSAVNLHESRVIGGRFIGDVQLRKALEQNIARPMCLATGDFDEDGMPDLVAAYDAPSAGILVMHRGNVHAIFANRSQKQELATYDVDAASPFLDPSHIFPAPKYPTFIGAGDFNADGHLDLVTAARDSNSLNLLAGDGAGNLAPAHLIPLPGTITALLSGEFNRRDGLADIVLGITGTSGAQVLIYASSEGALKGNPEVIPLPSPINALALGRLNGSAFEDLAVGAGNQLLVIEGRDTNQASVAGRSALSTAPIIQQLSFSNPIVALAAGDFPSGNRQRVALLQANGEVHVAGREATGWTSKLVTAFGPGQADGLFATRVSNHNGDDLVILGRDARELQILSHQSRSSDDKSKAPTSHEDSASVPPSNGGGLPVSSVDLEVARKTSASKKERKQARNVRGDTIGDLPPSQFNPQVSVTLEQAPVAVSSMRLTRDATSSLIILENEQTTIEFIGPPIDFYPQAAFTVVNVNDSGSGSLRQAILNANAAPGADTIIFDIFSSECQLPPCATRPINLLSPLPAITGPVVIDGYTEPFSSPNTLVNGNNAVLLIELNGASAGAADGLTITGGNSTIRGLIINRFNGSAISLSSNGNNIIEGNFLGTNARGTAAASNNFNGVFLINVANNLIGGTTPAARNIISGNGANSIPTFSYPNVYIGGVNGSGNSVLGNYVGTDVTGTSAITAAGAGGVHISGAPNNVVGSPTAGARNLVSGNDANGVLIGGDGSTTFPINASGNLVQNNFIGTNVSGTQALGNRLTAVPVQGPSNTIGGSTASARNLISGTSASSGVALIDTTASLNLLQGNFIGTDVNGSTALGNFRHGVIIIGASSNTVGGPTSGARNIISGNRLNGVSIETDATFPIAAQNLVQGNYIGTSSSGIAALGNSSHGVSIFGGNNGTVTGNLISGNGASQGFGGLVITATSSSGPGTGNVIQGNFVGTNATGNAAVGNRSFGITLAAPNNTVGGTSAQARNIIAGNGSEPGSEAVMIAATSGGLNGSGSVVQGNFIGTAADGTSPLGNVGSGVAIPQLAGVVFSDVRIGGTISGAGNVIAFNSQNGVVVGSGVGHSILSNSIFANGGLGIDLNPGGVTPNDSGDGDAGANNLQNFPILTSVVGSGGNTVVQGTLNSTPSTTFNIQFFSNGACDAAGNGEGQTFLGSTAVTTNAGGNATINTTLAVQVAAQFVTATATDPNNNTSEFSACRLGTPPSFLQFSSATLSAAEAAGSTLITVARTGGNGGPASVQFSTVAVGSASGGGSCTAGVDYVSTAGALNWADGESGNKTFSLTICDDNIFEGTETVPLALSSPSGADLATPSTVTLSITDNDSQPTLSINNTSRLEGNSGTSNMGFTVSLSNPTTQTVTVRYATANGTATAVGDYQPVSSTILTFGPNTTTLPVNISVVGDTLNESDETVFVNLNAPTNATISDGQGVGTIMNDDPPPTGTLKISGRVLDESGRPIVGHVVFLSGAASGSTSADAGGNYSFTSLSPGGYTVAPSILNYSFSPTNYSFNSVTQDRVAIFVGRPNVVSISGRLTDTNSTGLAGLSVALNKNGLAAGTTSTDVSGNYSFSNLEAGSNYEVTPGGNFTASRLFFNNLNTNTTANFRSLPIVLPSAATISGRVTDANGNPILNVTLTLSGPITGVVSPDAAGNFSFVNLTPGGNYAVTIQSSQYIFAPSRADFFNLAGTQTFNPSANPVVVPAPTPSVNDDFSGTTRDPNKWSLGIQTQPPQSFDPQVNVSQGSGQLVITPLTQAAGSHYNGYVSSNAFDMTNGSVSVTLAQAASGGADTAFAIGTDANNFFRFMVRTAGGPAISPMMIRGRDGVERALDTTVSQLLFQVMVAGQLTTLPIPYNQAQHMHLRFRHESEAISPPLGKIIFEASQNGFDWFVLHETLLTRRVNPMTAELSAGTATPTNPGQAIFTNYKLITRTFQFGAATYNVDEAGNSILITVTRTGSTDEIDKVDYSTSDGTATQTNNYINTAGRLTFAPQETSKTFRILIIDNATAEGNRNVNLLLQSLPSQGHSGLNAPARAVLTISDNDTIPPTVNPLDTAQYYVEVHYYDFFSREPDAPGFAFWTNQITGCGADTSCIEIRRINVSAAFFVSIEFQQTGYLVYKANQAAFNLGEQLRLQNFLPDTQEIGRGYIVNEPGAEELLERNKQNFFLDFVQRPAFLASSAYPTTLTATQFVDKLNQNTFDPLNPTSGPSLTLSQRQNLIDQLSADAASPTLRAQALRSVSENGVFSQRQFNKAFVLMQYFGYLRRNPNDPPESTLDFQGYNFWLNKLNQFNSNFVDAEMVKAFITSGEYRHRFGP